MSSLTSDREFEGLEVVGFVLEEAASGWVVVKLEVRDWVEGDRI